VRGQPGSASRTKRRATGTDDGVPGSVTSSAAPGVTTRCIKLTIAAIIAERIERGELEPDRPIPSEVQLEQEFGVARATARKAVAVLREEGLVVTVPGLGTYVSKR
jgi:GntR family transcriptional regulator